MKSGLPMDRNSDQIDIHPALEGADGEFGWFFFLNPKENKATKQESVVDVTNGQCKLSVAIVYLPRYSTWHVSGVLTFESSALPNDLVDSASLVTGALDEILRTATDISGTSAIDFGRVLKSSLFLMHCSDSYTLPSEADWQGAGRLLQQEVARTALTTGHLFDAASRVLFGNTTHCVPKLKSALKGHLVRDAALQARHVNIAATKNVQDQLQIMCFLTQSADELLVKPKMPPVVN